MSLNFTQHYQDNNHYIILSLKILIFIKTKVATYIDLLNSPFQLLFIIYNPNPRYHFSYSRFFILVEMFNNLFEYKGVLAMRTWTIVPQQIIRL